MKQKLKPKKITFQKMSLFDVNVMWSGGINNLNYLSHVKELDRV